MPQRSACKQMKGECVSPCWAQGGRHELGDRASLCLRKQQVWPGPWPRARAASRKETETRCSCKSRRHGSKLCSGGQAERRKERGQQKGRSGKLRGGGLDSLGGGGTRGLAGWAEKGSVTSPACVWGQDALGHWSGSQTLSLGDSCSLPCPLQHW